MWKGNEIREEWKKLPLSEFYTFFPLNHTDSSNQQIIHDYWLKNKRCSGLELI
jgi:hypothetical protein